MVRLQVHVNDDACCFVHEVPREDVVAFRGLLGKLSTASGVSFAAEEVLLLNGAAPNPEFVRIIKALMVTTTVHKVTIIRLIRLVGGCELKEAIDFYDALRAQE